MNTKLYNKLNTMKYAMLLLLFASCIDRVKKNAKQEDIDYVKSTATYFKDDATNLCFAYLTKAHLSGTVILLVPCDSVKNKLNIQYK